MPAGRPTKYRKAMCKVVIDEMSQGASKEATCGVLGISKQTFYRWAEEKPEFNDAVKRGEIMCGLWWEKLGRAATVGKVPGFNATSFVWMTKNILHWKDRQEVTGEGGGALTIRIAKADETL